MKAAFYKNLLQEHVIPSVVQKICDARAHFCRTVPIANQQIQFLLDENIELTDEQAVNQIC